MTTNKARTGPVLLGALAVVVLALTSCTISVPASETESSLAASETVDRQPPSAESQTELPPQETPSQVVVPAGPSKSAVADKSLDTWDYRTVIGLTGAENEVNLTFDDGPGPFTPEILDILDRYGVRATFCMTGQQVDSHPEIARDVLSRGHQLCNHSYAHQISVNHGSTQEILADIQKANSSYQREIGVESPGFYRAPEGVFGGHVPEALAQMRMRALGWTVDSRDWTKPGANAIVDNVKAALGPKRIILMHDGGGDRKQTIEALPTVIEAVRADGYTFSTPEEW